MKDVVVNLVIKDKSLTFLSGNDFGVQVFKDSFVGTYVKGTNVTFVVPNNIMRISASFIQGLIADISKQVGRANLSKYVSIKTSNKRIEDKFNIIVGKEEWKSPVSA